MKIKKSYFGSIQHHKNAMKLTESKKITSTINFEFLLYGNLEILGKKKNYPFQPN
jgi:hypothetical protein